MYAVYGTNPEGKDCNQVRGTNEPGNAGNVCSSSVRLLLNARHEREPEARMNGKLSASLYAHAGSVSYGFVSAFISGRTGSDGSL